MFCLIHALISVNVCAKSVCVSKGSDSKGMATRPAVQVMRKECDATCVSVERKGERDSEEER